MSNAGITCHVLAPTKIARSLQHERRKTDEKDAEVILQLLRAHVLAGNPLPTVWIPDPQTRDDREVARVRRVLCQATWACVRMPGENRDAYQRVVAKNPYKKKIAVVAAMRRLAVRMWHRARDVSPVATPHGSRPVTCREPKRHECGVS